MEKYFLPFVISICLLSAMAFMAVGDTYLSKNSNQDICVESRSCAINYMNHLEEDGKNQ